MQLPLVENQTYDKVIEKKNWYNKNSLVQFIVMEFGRIKIVQFV